MEKVVLCQLSGGRNCFEVIKCQKWLHEFGKTNLRPLIFHCTKRLGLKHI